MPTSPQASEASPRWRHSACCLPQHLVLYYHEVELLQLEQERNPARMSVKTYFLLFRDMAIDRLSHVSQKRESTISQFLRNVAVRPKLWHTTVQPRLNWVRFGPSETSFNMAAAAETKWRWDLHMVKWENTSQFVLVNDPDHERRMRFHCAMYFRGLISCIYKKATMGDAEGYIWKKHCQVYSHWFVQLLLFFFVVVYRYLNRSETVAKLF